MAIKNIYLNNVQINFLNAPQKVKTLIAGRGLGKSTVNGFESYNIMTNLPRCKGCLVGLTYRQLLTKVMPEMIKAWESIGLVENIHYVVGKRPPARWNTPLSPPKKYDNCITLCNGSCMELLSFDRGDLSRGGSYDFMIMDEAVLFSKELHDKVLLPMIRGNIYKFPNSPYLHRRIYTSSQTWLESGAWVPDMTILAKGNPERYYYAEGTALDNIDVLGQEYLDDLKKNLPYWTYQVEVMNIRLKKLPNCFYNELNENTHLYSGTYTYGGEFAFWQSVEYTDTDYDPMRSLELSFDFGASICCLTVAQEFANEERFINEFYKKREDGEGSQVALLPALLTEFINYYKPKHKSLLIIRGDRNGNNRRADSYTTLYEDIIEVLKKNGFDCIKEVDGLDAFHSSKHNVLNKILGEKDPNLPKVRINRDKCTNLIISMQQTPILPDFKKDKRSEQNDTPQEKATHFSDCFDNHFHKKNKYRHLFTSQSEHVAPII